MAIVTARVDSFRSWTCFHASGLASLAFVAAIAGLAVAANNLAAAVYSLSFWHYYLYWLAYRFGAVPIEVFQRDAIGMKSVALGVTGWAYVSSGFDGLSAAVVIAGFALNAWAARVLGTNRTYYGYELADLAPLRVTRLPYSWISHPMLVGNMAAYGGMLLNPQFRAAWWPLAAVHVLLNLGLLAMELLVEPLRLSARAQASLAPPTPTVRGKLSVAGFVLAGLTLGCGLGGLAAWRSNPALGASVGACLGIYAFALFRWYRGPGLTTND